MAQRSLSIYKGRFQQRGIDNLIRGLVDLLPKPGSNWSLNDRAKWFRLAAGIFDLGYKAGEGKDQEISIAFVAQGPQAAGRWRTRTDPWKRPRELRALHLADQVGEAL
jgi:hypothetical protein